MLEQLLAINFFLASCNVCPVANTRIQLPTIYSLCSGHCSKGIVHIDLTAQGENISLLSFFFFSTVQKGPGNSAERGGACYVNGTRKTSTRGKRKDQTGGEHFHP